VELTPYAIFDMDGTLLCSTGMWDHVTDRILAKYGKTITHEQRMANMTLTVEGTAAMFVQQLGVPLTEPECVELIRAEARYGYAQEATVKPGVEQVLAAMHARGVRMCVASGTETPLIEAALTSHGLMRWFEFAVDCKNPDGKKKPDVYLDALACRTPCRQPCLRIPPWGLPPHAPPVSPPLAFMMSQWQSSGRRSPKRRILPAAPGRTGCKMCSRPAPHPANKHETIRIEACYEADHLYRTVL